MPARLQEAITALAVREVTGSHRFCPKSGHRVKGRPTFREETGRTAQPAAEATRPAHASPVAAPRAGARPLVPSKNQESSCYDVEASVLRAHDTLPIQRTLA